LGGHSGPKSLIVWMMTPPKIHIVYITNRYLSNVLKGPQFDSKGGAMRLAKLSLFPLVLFSSLSATAQNLTTVRVLLGVGLTAAFRESSRSCSRCGFSRGLTRSRRISRPS
jgi:hypothetical protein